MVFVVVVTIYFGYLSADFVARSASLWPEYSCELTLKNVMRIPLSFIHILVSVSWLARLSPVFVPRIRSAIRPTSYKLPTKAR